MENFIYFNTEYAIKLHDNIIIKSGGVLGIRDLGLLESSLEHIQNDFYYPNIEHKLTHLLYSINKNHCFNDGNKRASLAFCVYFLMLNGLDFLTKRFILEMENIVVDVADNTINKDLLLEIIESLIYEYNYSEQLKLKIINSKIDKYL